MSLNGMHRYRNTMIPQFDTETTEILVIYYWTKLPLL